MDPSRSGWTLSAKLTLAYSLLILIVSGTFTLGLYYQLQTAQRQAIQERLHDIVSFAEPLVDGDYHSLIQSPEDETSSFYRYIALRLQSIQDTSEVIERIYTLRQGDDGRIIFVVDVDPVAHARVGQAYVRASPLLEKGLTAIPGPMVEDSLYTDDSGTFLSGYAPIYDQFQELDGVLGIDINAAGVIASETQARRTALAAFLVTVPFSLLTGWWLARRLTAPMRELVSGVERVAQGQLDEVMPVRSRDELGVLANAFNHMTAQLQQTMGGLEQEITERVQAQDALHHSHRELTLLNRVIAAASTTMEPKAVLQTICRELALRFDVPLAAAALLNEKRTTSVVVAEYLAEGYSSALDVVIPFEGNPITQYVIDHKTPLVVLDAQHDPRMAAIHDVMRRRGTVSLLILPLIVRGQVVGTLGLDAVERREFSDEEVALATRAVAAAAQVLENARLFEAEIQARQISESLRGIARELNVAPDLNTALDLVLSRMARVITSDGSSVMLLAKGQMSLAAVRGFAEPDSILNAQLDLEIALLNREVIETRQPLIIASVSGDQRWVESMEASGLPASLENIQSWMGVPLLVQDRVIGMLTLDKVEPDFYRPEDAELALAFASHAAIAIRNAQLLEETQRRLDYLQALHKIDNAISGSLDLQVMLKVLLGQVVTQLKVDAADVLLFKRETQNLVYAAGLGFRTGAIRDIQRIGQSPAGNAVQERRIVHVANLRKRVTGFLLSPSLQSENFVAYYGIPLIAKGQVVGVLEIFHRSQLGSDSEWLNFLITIAGQAAIAIENATLFDDLQRSNLALRLAYENTLEGWARALELRDMETEGHSRRVVDMTMQLAQRMNVRGTELTPIRWGALMHDIGKMGIPDSILQKPGPLTDEEWVLMKKHPTIAYELLLPIDYLQSALDIPWCHHERWDGSGYPRGLRGEQIPLSARIFAVVDVWDALNSDRPYRVAWHKEQAIEYIRANAGSHFDPQVVKVFFDTRVPNGKSL